MFLASTKYSNEGGTSVLCLFITPYPRLQHCCLFSSEQVYIIFLWIIKSCSAGFNTYFHITLYNHLISFHRWCKFGQVLLIFLWVYVFHLTFYRVYLGTCLVYMYMYIWFIWLLWTPSELSNILAMLVHLSKAKKNFKV
jgi:hypothetical protein